MPQDIPVDRKRFDEKLCEIAGCSTIVAHYTKKDTLLEHILPDFTLRLGRLSKTNDPRETKEWSLPSIYTEGEATHHEEANRHLNAVLRDRSYVACGTLNRGDKRDCYVRPRMWAQCGDNHRGACLLINSEALKEELSRQIEEKDQLYSELIKYSDRFPFPTPVRLRNDPIQRGVDEFLQNEEHRRYFLLYKHPDWQDEREHRWIIVKQNGQCEACYVSLRKALLGIVVGVDFPDVYIPLLKRLLNEQFPMSSNVLLGKMRWLYMDSPSVRLIRWKRKA